MENTGVFRHIVGHGTALTDQTVFLQEAGTVVVFDYDSEGGGSSGIGRFASSIEPGKVFIAGTMYDCASQSEYLGVEPE